MSETLGAMPSIPAHVPADRVFDFDLFARLPAGQDSQAFLCGVRDRTPDVFYSPRNGGHWVATRAKDIERIQLDHEVFSHEVISLPREANVPLYPLTLDPPQHGQFRRLINPAFTPRAIEALEGTVRDVARAQVALLAPRGGCEFVADFARVLPTSVFLTMVDLPLDDRADLLAWTEVMTRSPDLAARGGAQQSMVGYLARWIMERSAAPGQDLLSRVVSGQVEGRKLTMEEQMSVCLLLLFGGLDTVASMLGFVTRFLAMNPAHQQALRTDPALIPQAIEELLRRHGVANTTRLVKQEVELAGATLHPGDLVLAPNTFVGLDDRLVERPLEVDFHRASPAAMGIFGKGPHMCPGAMLARREIRIFLEEWLQAIPAFRVADGTVPVVEIGNVSGVTRLDLAW